MGWTTAKSGYVGVKMRRSGSYQARIWYGGKDLHLGTFPSGEEAAREYDRAAEFKMVNCTSTAPITFNFPEEARAPLDLDEMLAATSSRSAAPKS